MFFRKKLTFLVVCKANITRSAYLHGYMQNYLKQHMPYARKKVRILSGGVQARGGSSAHQVVRHVARQNGFSLSGHQSSALTARRINKADVILVMEAWQKDRIIERFPQAEEKTYRMMEYLWRGEENEIQDIPDPTGHDTTDYQEFIEVAHSEVERIFHELAREDII